MSTITETLPQTDSLQQPEDLSALMVQKLDQFLMQAIDSAASEQAQYWSPDEADPVHVAGAGNRVARVIVRVLPDEGVVGLA